MCGIFFYITKSLITLDFIKDKITLLSHRGPDSYNYELLKHIDWNILLIHTRLKINGNDDKQPLNLNNIYLLMNGEIFNHKLISLNEMLSECKSSDCEIVLKLYDKYKNKDLQQNLFEKLNGQYSFVLLDLDNSRVVIGRDHIGITPLYTSINENEIVISSELKALTNSSMRLSFSNIKIFYPRSYGIIDIKETLNYTQKIWKNYFDFAQNNSLQEQSIQEKVKSLLKTSVTKRLDDLIKNNIDFGVLVSGGLDSSLICSLIHEYYTEKQIKKRIDTFSIGVDENAVDIKFARKVSQHLGTNHNEYYFTVNEGYESLKDVIWAIESYDTTSIRASTPMYLLTKKIKNDFNNIKVLFSGEGADELFLSYRYGMKAPSENAFYDENKNLISNVHKFDCLRANKSCMANGIEVRVPFLDVDFVDFVMKIPVRYKMYDGKIICEKHLLREAFDNGDYLPKDVLWRVKEQFSDGVSSNKNGDNEENNSNWIKFLKDQAQKLYIDVFNKNMYKINKPENKEELMYRDIFTKLFKQNSSAHTVSIWKPKWSNTTDPSGRLYVL